MRKLSGRVIAFEPNPRTLETLRANVAASRASNVTIVPAACTECETTVRFFDATPAHNSGCSSLSHANAGELAREVAVAGRPIDAVLRELGVDRVAAMKVDVEGAELPALRGAAQTLRRFHPKIVIEAVPSLLAGMNASIEELFAFLKDTGYSGSRRLDADNWEWTAESP
jgi:FkbM family methyltransferase